MADICLMVIKYRLQETYGEWRDWWRAATWRDIDILSLLLVAWILFAGLSMGITLLIKSLALKIAGVKPEDQSSPIEAEEAEELLPEAPRMPPLPSPANHNHKTHDNPGHSLPPLTIPVKVAPKQTFVVNEEPQNIKRNCSPLPQQKLAPTDRPSQSQQPHKSEAPPETATAQESSVWLNELVRWLANLVNDGSPSNRAFTLSPSNFNNTSRNMGINDSSPLSPLVSVWMLALNEALASLSDVSSPSSSNSSPPVLKTQLSTNPKGSSLPGPSPNKSFVPLLLHFDGVLPQSAPPSIVRIRLDSNTKKSLVLLLSLRLTKIRMQMSATGQGNTHLTSSFVISLINTSVLVRVEIIHREGHQLTIRGQITQFSEFHIELPKELPPGVTKEWLEERIQQALRDARVRINLNSIVARVSNASSPAPNPNMSAHQILTPAPVPVLEPTQATISSVQIPVVVGQQLSPPNSVLGFLSTQSDAQQAYNRSTSCPPSKSQVVIPMQDSPASLENLVDVNGGDGFDSPPSAPKQAVSHTFSCPVPNEPKEPKKPSRIAIARAGTIAKSKAICESDPDDLPNAKYSEAPPPPSKFSPVEERVTLMTPFTTSESGRAVPPGGPVLRLPPSVPLPNGSARDPKEFVRAPPSAPIGGLSHNQNGLWMSAGVSPSAILDGRGSASPPQSCGSQELCSEHQSTQKFNGKQPLTGASLNTTGASAERPKVLANNMAPVQQSSDGVRTPIAEDQEVTLPTKNNDVEDGGEGSNGSALQPPLYLNSSNSHNALAHHLSPKSLSPTTPATTPVVIEFPVLLQLRLLKATGLSSHSGQMLNPYCNVTVDWPQQRFQTKTLHNTKAPFWDAFFNVALEQNSKFIIFRIHNQDELCNIDSEIDEEATLIGEAVFDVKTFIARPLSQTSIATSAAVDIPVSRPTALNASPLHADRPSRHLLPIRSRNQPAQPIIVKDADGQGATLINYSLPAKTLGVLTIEALIIATSAKQGLSPSDVSIEPSLISNSGVHYQVVSPSPSVRPLPNSSMLTSGGNIGGLMDSLSALRLSNSIPATRALEARLPAGVEHSLSHTMPSVMSSTLLAQSGNHNHRQQRQPPPTVPLRQWHRQRLEGQGGHSSAGAGSGGHLATASIEGYRERQRERGRRRERSRPPDPVSTTSSTITSVTTNASSFEVDGEVSHDEQEAGLRTAVAAQRSRGTLRSRRKAPGEPPFSPTYSPLANLVASRQQQHAHPHDSAGRNRHEAHSHSVERQRRRRREQTHRQPSHSVDASPMGSPVVMRRHHQQAEAGEVDPGTYPPLSVELDPRAIPTSGPLSQRLLALAPRAGAANEAPPAPTRVSSLAPRDPSALPLSPHPDAAYFEPASNSLPNSMQHIAEPSLQLVDYSETNEALDEKTAQENGSKRSRSFPYKTRRGHSRRDETIDSQVSVAMPQQAPMEALKYMHRGPPVAAVEMTPHVPSVPSRKVSTVGRALEPPPNSIVDASSAPVLPLRKVSRARAPLPPVPISPDPLQRQRQQQQEIDADITLQVPQGLARHRNNSHTRDKDPNGDLSPPPPPPRRAKSAERIRRPGAQQEEGSFSPQSLSYSQVPVPSSHRSSNRSHVVQELDPASVQNPLLRSKSRGFSRSLKRIFGFKRKSGPPPLPPKDSVMSSSAASRSTSPPTAVSQLGGQPLLAVPTAITRSTSNPGPVVGGGDTSFLLSVPRVTPPDSRSGSFSQRFTPLVQRHNYQFY